MGSNSSKSDDKGYIPNHFSQMKSFLKDSNKKIVEVMNSNQQTGPHMNQNLSNNNIHSVQNVVSASSSSFQPALTNSQSFNSAPNFNSAPRGNSKQDTRVNLFRTLQSIKTDTEKERQKNLEFYNIYLEVKKIIIKSWNEIHNLQNNDIVMNTNILYYLDELLERKSLLFFIMYHIYINDRNTIHRLLEKFNVKKTPELFIFSEREALKLIENKNTNKMSDPIFAFEDQYTNLLKLSTKDLRNIVFDILKNDNDKRVFIYHINEIKRNNRILVTKFIDKKIEQPKFDFKMYALFLFERLIIDGSVKVEVIDLFINHKNYFTLISYVEFINYLGVYIDNLFHLFNKLVNAKNNTEIAVKFIIFVKNKELFHYTRVSETTLQLMAGKYGWNAEKIQKEASNDEYIIYKYGVQEILRNMVSMKLTDQKNISEDIRNTFGQSLLDIVITIKQVYEKCKDLIDINFVKNILQIISLYTNVDLQSIVYDLLIKIFNEDHNQEKINTILLLKNSLEKQMDVNFLTNEILAKHNKGIPTNINFCHKSVENYLVSHSVESIAKMMEINNVESIKEAIYSVISSSIINDYNVEIEAALLYYMISEKLYAVNICEKLIRFITLHYKHEKFVFLFNLFFEESFEKYVNDFFDLCMNDSKDYVNFLSSINYNSIAESNHQVFFSYMTTRIEYIYKIFQHYAICKFLSKSNPNGILIKFDVNNIEKLYKYLNKELNLIKRKFNSSTFHNLIKKVVKTYYWLLFKNDLFKDDVFTSLSRLNDKHYNEEDEKLIKNKNILIIQNLDILQKDNNSSKILALSNYVNKGYVYLIGELAQERTNSKISRYTVIKQSMEHILQFDYHQFCSKNHCKNIFMPIQTNMTPYFDSLFQRKSEFDSVLKYLDLNYEFTPTIIINAFLLHYINKSNDLDDIIIKELSNLIKINTSTIWEFCLGDKDIENEGFDERLKQFLLEMKHFVSILKLYNKLNVNMYTIPKKYDVYVSLDQVLSAINLNIEKLGDTGYAHQILCVYTNLFSVQIQFIDLSNLLLLYFVKSIVPRKDNLFGDSNKNNSLKRSLNILQGSNKKIRWGTNSEQEFH